jgi:hypothetical protein
MFSGYVGLPKFFGHGLFSVEVVSLHFTKLKLSFGNSLTLNATSENKFTESLRHVWNPDSILLTKVSPP